MPLNLATSIFGMNIQQLNGNGQHLWVFITTAVIALIITAGSWLSADGLAKGKAVAWYRKHTAAKRPNKEAEDEREYGLLRRMAMLLWLVRNGHKAWMWHSGAWIAILVNSKARGRLCLCDGLPTSGKQWEGLEMPACKYVSLCSKLEKEDQEHHFQVKSGTANKTWSPLR